MQEICDDKKIIRDNGPLKVTNIIGMKSYKNVALQFQLITPIMEVCGVYFLVRKASLKFSTTH